MSGFWRTATGNYYEGDQIAGTDIMVPRRPDGNYVWNGSDGWDRSSQLGATQDYLEFLSTPVSVVFTGTPALNASYDVDAQAQSFITSIADGIANGKGLPGGGDTFKYNDTTSTSHDFNAANFLNMAKAIEDFVFLGFQEYHNRITGGQANAFPVGPLNLA